MTSEALIALLPIIAVSLASLAVMLGIAVKRDSRLALGLTLGGLIATLAVLPISLAHASQAVTGLLRIDAYALFFSGLLAVVAALVAVLCHSYFRRQEREEIYVLLLTATLGGLLLVSSNHFAMFFLGLEILSVSLFPLIAFRASHKMSLEAGIKYLMLSGVSSALLLFGLALVYAALGTLSFQQLAMAGSAVDPLSLVGVVLLLAGLGFKLSLVPFHLWTADVYQGAPAPVTAFIATVSKTAVFALLVRLWIGAGVYREEILLDLLGIVGAVSILAGNLLALLQTNIKRLLAYSSIAHLGYVLVAFVAGSVLRLELFVEGVGFYLLAYIISTLGAFGVVTALSHDAAETEEIAAYSGLFWREPGLALMLALSLLSLAGIPLTVGFIGKFYVFAVGIDAALWGLVATMVAGSGIGIYYYLKVISVMVGDSGQTSQGLVIPFIAKPVLVFLALLLVGSGIYPKPLMEVFQILAKALP